MLTLKQRKQLWKDRAGKFTEVAAECGGISPNHVRLVFVGERRSEPVEEALARRLGVPRDVAFPALPKRTRAARSKITAKVA